MSSHAAASTRSHVPNQGEPAPTPAEEMVVVARLLKRYYARLAGADDPARRRRLCNRCELEIRALTNALQPRGHRHTLCREPRHAVLLVTGPVSAPPAIALKRTYDATRHALVVAVSDCGCTADLRPELRQPGRGQHDTSRCRDPRLPAAAARAVQGILAAVTARAPVAARGRPAVEPTSPVAGRTRHP